VETLAWEIFEEHLHASNPSILEMGGTRKVRIGFDPLSRWMFIWLPVDPAVSIPPSPYSELELETVQDETGYVLQIKTRAQHLFREFHRFAGIITEDFEQPQQTALSAFETAIRRWQELAAARSLLSEEQRLGLQGELTFLRALLKVEGPKGVVAWTGRNIAMPERHDFRINAFDIEVKSTRGLRRQHVIHGLEQLQASIGHTLYLLSLRFETAGLRSGRSLSDEIQEIRSNLAQGGTERTEFDKMILAAGYDDDDAPYYDEKLILADSPVLVMVDEGFPKITREIISGALVPELAGRLKDVSYRVDIEGLGVKQGSQQFLDVLGQLLLEV
jgi:putative PD-(D/E)XK family protein DUF4420